MFENVLVSSFYHHRPSILYSHYTVHDTIGTCILTATTRTTTTVTVTATVQYYIIMSGGGGGDPWAWLGLLKWSLSYSDGTHESPTSMTPLSAEDRAFLEKVMKEGIIDENERMKTILKEVTAIIETWKQEAEANTEAKSATVMTQEQDDEMQDRLQELRDIVEQIDYARAFAAMKGLNFLLGCVQERQCIPRSMRGMCLGIIATMCQHNPPVQKELLELGAIRILSDVFFIEHEQRAVDGNDMDGQLRARIIQAISANVRSHDLAEAVFCQLDQAPRLIALGLTGGSEGDKDYAPTALRQRTLFFLKALLTSDSSTRERVERFSGCIGYVLDAGMLDTGIPGDTSVSSSSSPEIRENALDLVQQVLEQKLSVNAVLDRKDTLASTAVRRVMEIRNLSLAEEKEYAAVELAHWEQVLVLLARATRDEDVTTSTSTTSTPEESSPTLLLASGSNP
jgi:hsp70-interacting protein